MRAVRLSLSTCRCVIVFAESFRERCALVRRKGYRRHRIITGDKCVIRYFRGDPLSPPSSRPRVLVKNLHSGD